MLTGRVDDCWWILMSGTVTPAQHAQMVARLRAWGASATPSTMLHLAQTQNLPTPAERKELATTLREIERPERLRYALVTSSTMLRGVLLAVNWLADSKLSQQVFGTPTAALSWLQRNDANRVADVEAALTLAVPDYGALRW